MYFSLFSCITVIRCKVCAPENAPCLVEGLHLHDYFSNDFFELVEKWRSRGGLTQNMRGGNIPLSEKV